MYVGARATQELTCWTQAHFAQSALLPGGALHASQKPTLPAQATGNSGCPKASDCLPKSHAGGEWRQTSHRGLVAKAAGGQLSFRGASRPLPFPPTAPLPHLK